MSRQILYLDYELTFLKFDRTIDKMSFLGKLEAVVQTRRVKKVLLKFRKIHRKTFYTATLLKKRLWHKSFPGNFTKFLRTPFFIEYLWWLLLEN